MNTENIVDSWLYTNNKCCTPNIVELYKNELQLLHGYYADHLTGRQSRGYDECNTHRTSVKCNLRWIPTQYTPTCFGSPFKRLPRSIKLDRATNHSNSALASLLFLVQDSIMFRSETFLHALRHDISESLVRSRTSLGSCHNYTVFTCLSYNN